MGSAALQLQASQNKLALPNSVEASKLLEKFTSKIQPGQPSPQPSPQASQAPQSPSQADGSSLVVGIPLGLLKEEYVWDGVITKLSDQNSEDLGNLKLSDMVPEHVKMYLTKDATGTKYSIALVGCVDSCTETSQVVDLQDLPVVAVDTANEMLMVDLSAVGKDLDLISGIDPQGQRTHLQTVSTKTVSFDYSVSTLVFDVESHMIPVDAKPTDPGVKETVFTTRWFLRLGSAFNPAFEARPPTDGVGFFETDRNMSTKVVRWSTTSPDGVAPVHYYIKNVPAEYQTAFQAAFDEWNQKLRPIVGKDMFSYEFVGANDPMNALLVAGDPRFNIVEWDIENHASYGGLGPSIANQFTGEDITTNVLIQGPQIETMYKDWFKVNKRAQELRSEGQDQAADELLIDSRHRIYDQLDELAARPKFELTMNQLKFRLHAQRPEVSDPIAQRNDFDPLPPGLTYDEYMYGYFRDMLTHELGHNLGLRHNFKGNLGSTGDTEGHVSRSVMEYLARDYRYLDHVGSYDLMALTYGYTGAKPGHLDWYCTDENSVENDPVGNSAECTSNDATSDPFGWYEMRLGEAIDYLVGRGKTDDPTWTVDEMARELGIAVHGMGYYATSAKETAHTWVKFFTGKHRPLSPSGVRSYVIARIKAQICNPSLETEAKMKSTPEAQAKTTANITALRAKVAELIGSQGVIAAAEMKCQ